MIRIAQPVTVRKKFVYREFYRSDRHPDVVRVIPFNGRIAQSIAWWVLACGDPFRLDNPDVRLVPTSGVRDKALNGLIGGHPNSNHLIGENPGPDQFTNYCAVDLTSPDLGACELFARVVNGGYPYRQLILYPERNIIHWSWNRVEHSYRREIMITRGGSSRDQ